MCVLDTRINLRVKNILKKIFSTSDYITVTAIAKELGISNRTILRELPAAEKWLLNTGCRLEKKSGVGIRAIGKPEDKNNLINLLDEEKEEKLYTPKERQTIICSELLQNQEPVKLYTFTRILDVAEATVSNDLDKLEEWLGKQEVTLVRKPGLGVYIEGEEDNIRKCMINLIYENINENHLLGLIRKNISKEQVPVSNTELIARSRLLNLVNGNTIHQLEKLVHQAEERIGYNLADSAVVGLIVHLAIAVQRIRKNEDIVIDKKFMEELKNSEEYTVAEKLAHEIEDIFDIKVPSDEIGYITMHIKGSKNIKTNEKDSGNFIGNNELVELSREIIRIAENETGKFLSQNEKLLTGLTNHLGPAINRLKMNLEIRNPLYTQIKTHYPDLMILAEKCIKVVEEYIDIKMPDTEIAYIAMHLGAAIEKSKVSPKRVFRAAIACATGIGTSRLLATRIEKEYDNIEVAGTVSMFNINNNWLKEKGIELIISTVVLDECPVPVVVVNPLLFQEDKARIDTLLEEVRNTCPNQPSGKKKTLNFKEKMFELNCYNNAITEILDNFFYIGDTQAEDVSQLINDISRMACSSEEDREQLVKDMEEREEKGGTFIPEYGIKLLHCRTKAVSQIHFGIIKLNKDIKNKGNIKEGAELAMVAVAPEGSSRYMLETISHVNGILVDQPEFIRILKDGSKEDIFDELCSILEEYYNEKNNKYMKN
ncbi:BglG family transcription antiterminator [Ruminiclostridium cellobioparum]|uniref:Transcriptional antiterminator n=1 Tax=Ruminiclostridium cellobioparum subsp. termitidis CT1112 TaxID=1195236 RepID=S0FLA3_RUMCE|nr:PRD domain-containing protein [Ruminiclostridium cellobioparum]EMS72995.1 Transcriptional antiterminator [Ruminiclostridium cellobioparum subsp. termitidis CT1112]